jgi:4-hydroxy-tetrahydrodipicolinate reductase
MTTNVCVVGATGKFGRAIIAQSSTDIKITGAVCNDSNSLVGKPLNQIGGEKSDTIITAISQLEKAVDASDVVLFVSKPDADLTNIPKVIGLRKRVVVGTTGFTESQMNQLNLFLQEVPSILASNFSVGANLLFKITQLLSGFGNIYDYSIVENHHKMKADAPSGTAKTMLQLLNQNHQFSGTVTDRIAKPKRMPGEIEMVSLRGGGTPGIHQLILSGEHDMINVQHISFSNSAAAKGAILACRWIASKNEPGIYSMQDVLGSVTTINE